MGLLNELWRPTPPENHITVRSVDEAVKISGQMTAPREIILAGEVAHFEYVNQKETDQYSPKPDAVSPEPINDPNVYTIPEDADSQTADAIVADFLNLEQPYQEEQNPEKQQTNRSLLTKSAVLFENITRSRLVLQKDDYCFP